MNSFTFNRWVRRSSFYLLIFIICYIIFHFISTSFGFNKTDADSARYMISTLIQSEATIVAIVVSLSLVAIQQVATSYSPKVIDAFKQHPDLWILLSTYLFSIFYGTWVLKQITVDKSGQQMELNDFVFFQNINFFINFEDHISFVYLLAFFSFLTVVPYILNTLELLKPSNLIDILSENITEHNLQSLSIAEQNRILEYALPSYYQQKLITYNHKKNIEIEDPIQPIIDIISISLIKFDYETVRIGMEAIGIRIASILTSYEIKESRLSQENFLRKITNHIERVGQFASEKTDGEALYEVSRSLDIIGKSAAKRGMIIETKIIVSSIEKIGNLSVDKEVEYALMRVLWSLVEIRKILAEKGNNIEFVSYSIDNIKSYAEYNSYEKINSCLEFVNKMQKIYENKSA